MSRRRNSRPWVLVLVACAIWQVGEIAVWSPRAAAWQFSCFSQPGSLSEEMREANVSLVARLRGKVEKECGLAPDKQRPLTNERFRRFDIVEFFKGAELLGDQDFIEIEFHGDQPPGTLFVIHGTLDEKMIWNSPLALNDQSLTYVRQLPGLRGTVAERLKFFYRHLQAVDELISGDAHEEFLSAAYSDRKAARDCYDHDSLIAWIQNEETRNSRRRLYLEMLGIVSRGNPQPEDLQLLEGELNSTAERKPCLDAAIGCYLTLQGESALQRIEEKYLTNIDCPYPETYSAIMALRFHEMDENVIPHARLAAALRLILARPDLADIVMPDLARLEDWSVIDRLVELFKDCDGKTSWVRIPVLQYLKSCPLPEAKVHLLALEELDPECAKKAAQFAPYGKKAAGENGP